jgi:energy-coupling factor transporter ATP-binding protein EcfA2
LWNSTEQSVWKMVKSTHESDAGGPVTRRRELVDGVFECAWCVDLVGPRSMRPIGQIALDMEQVRVAEILDMMKPFEDEKRLQRLGAVVDCVYYQSNEFVILQNEVKAAELPSGAPKFKIKVEDACRSPVKWTGSPTLRHHVLNFEPLAWSHHNDPSIDELLALIEERRGALITGPAGTGKTWTMRKALKQLQRTLKAQGIELRNLNCAIRHAAARLIGGSTIAHLLNKYRQQGGPKFAKNCIILIDEASEIPLSMWTELAQWYLLGVRFVIIGDFDGQFLPMFDRWGEAMAKNDIQTSLFFHSLCEGTHVHFTQYRRGDESARPLFDFYCSLYQRLKLQNQRAMLDASLEEAKERFKACPVIPDVTLCASHYKRRLLNHAVNMTLARQEDKTLFIPCTKTKALGVTMVPQDMTIWKGLELLGCIHQSNSKTVINGVLYVVQDWDERFVYLNVHERYQTQPDDDSDEEPEPEDQDDDAVEDPAEGDVPTDLKLSHENVSKWLRLTHVRCYGSIQGCTMEKQHILLMDTHSRHFTLRHLIVGVSRATHQDFVHVDPAYEAILVSGAKAVAQDSMGAGGENPCDYTDDDFDDANDLALYCNDPEDIPWDELQPPVVVDADSDEVM